VKLFDISLEMKAVRAMVGEHEQSANVLLGLCNENHFQTTAGKAAFRRITTIMRNTGSRPDYDTLCHDTKLPERVRAKLRKAAKLRVRSKKRASAIARQLNNFRRIRIVHEMHREGVEALKGETIDVDEMLANISLKVMEAASTGERETLFNYGDNNNTRRVLKDYLKGTATRFIPTGFDSFDRRSAGIPLGGLFLIAANTGGGKSTLAQVLAHNWAKQGYRTCIVGLEMNETEMMMRRMSYLTKIPLERMLRPADLTRKEVKKLTRAWREYTSDLKKRGSVETHMIPDEDLTIEEVLFRLKPFSYPVIIIDYINLLKGASTDDQWRKLSDIARFCKRFAEANRCIVVILAQLSEEGIIRYSKGMKEHACVIGNTLIDTPNGVIPIQDLVAMDEPGNRHIQEMVTSQNGVGIALRAHNNGKKPVYKLVTERGVEITATGNHRFAVMGIKGVEWRELKKLQPTDHIIFNQQYIWPRSQMRLQVEYRHKFDRSQRVKVPKRMNKEFARLIGYLIGDGHICNEQKRWRVHFANHNPILIADYVRCFEKVFGITPSPVKGGVVVYKKQVSEILASIPGLTGKANSKYIPDVIMQSPRNIVGECLGALYDCDGGSGIDRKAFSTTSKEMSHRFRLLLQRLGIYAKQNGEEKKVEKTWSSGWSFEVAGIANLELWNKYIRCIHPNKQYQHTTKWRKRPDYHLQSVRSVTYVGKQTVYDLTVPGTDSFVANGMIVHNSNMWTWVRDKASKEAGMIYVQQQKNRNQPDYNFYLAEDYGTMTVRDPTEEELKGFESYVKGNGGSEGGKKGKGGKGGSKKRPKEEQDESLDDYLED
jgi:replicative DNA helicase